MRLTYYGHSCFSISLAGKQIMFDPFITPNERANEVELNSIKADYILVTHGHVDHIADCVQLAKQTGATVVSSWEICGWLQKQGIEKVHPMNTGGKWDFDFGRVKCVTAHHSSGLPDGSYGGNPMGFVITSGDTNFYNSGDTALSLDMQLIPKWAKLNFSIFPIGDNFTMGYEDAIEAARLVQCTTVVGVHYDTFPYIVIDHEQVKQAFSAAGISLLLPRIGESIEL